MRQDRFLLALLVGIAVLVVAALALFVVRRGQADYGPEDTPEGVLRNYIIALEKEEYQRAYSYLKEGEAKPDFDHFQKVFLSGQLDPSNAAVQIGELRQGEDDVVIEVVTIQRSGGPFGDSYRNSDNAFLEKDSSGAWKLAGMPYPYWNWDWYTPSALTPPEKIIP